MKRFDDFTVLSEVKRAALILTVVAGGAMLAADRPLLWKDPGPVNMLDLAAGPANRSAAPKPPFTFVKEETRGISPKLVVTDAKGAKWMVKFGDEAKSETFASRIAWAAGFPVRPCWYLPSGRIEGVNDLKRTKSFVQPDGSFSTARFQMFDNDSFHEVPGRLDLNDRSGDLLHLNGLKLALLLVANWDVKPANTAVFEIAGQRYATVSDWGASLGDPGAADPPKRKWSCQAYTSRTQHLIDGVDNGYVSFNYDQYVAKNVDTLSQGIRVEDVKWFADRMSKLSDNQLHSALLASGATQEEADCFTAGIRKRLQSFAAAASGHSDTVTTRSVTKTTRTSREPANQ